MFARSLRYAYLALTWFSPMAAIGTGAGAGSGIGAASTWRMRGDETRREKRIEKRKVKTIERENIVDGDFRLFVENL